MGNTYLTDPLVFLLTVIFDIFLIAVLLRFLFQCFRVDFYNPISQTLVKITSPILNPLRKIIPGIGGLDIAAVVLAFLITGVKYFLTYQIQGQSLPFSIIAVLSLKEIISLIINIFFFAILIQVILSWIAPGQYNPVTMIIHQLTAPILQPIRRILPDMGGLDLSPLVAMVALQIARMLILPPLNQLLLL